MDAELAVELLKFALYKEVKSKKRTKKPRTEQQSDALASEDSDSDGGDGQNIRCECGRKQALRADEY